MIVPKYTTSLWDYTATGTTPGWWTKSATYWQKKADDPNGSDTGFEQAFSNLAHAYLKDKAPKLMDYEIGFQMLDRNEERTKAVAVLGFKLGDQWLFAPIFFLNGDLKGHQLLYVKNQDTFLPLTDAWVNYLLGRKPAHLGEGVGRNLGILGIQQPYLGTIGRSPYKYAGDKEVMPAWSLSAFQTFAKVAVSEVSEPAELAKFIRETGRQTVELLLTKVASAYPDVFEAFQEFYPGLLEDAIKVVPEVKTAAAKIDPAPELFIHTRGSLLAGVGLSKEAKEQVARGERVFEDRRVTKSVAYRVEVPTEMRNPNTTGLYDVILNGGDAVKCLVVRAPAAYARGNPVTLDGSGKFVKTDPAAAIVVALEGDSKGKYSISVPTAVWTINQYSDAEYHAWFDDLQDSEISGEKCNLLIGPLKTGMLPFRVDGGSEPMIVNTDRGYRGWDVRFCRYGLSGHSAPYPPQPYAQNDPIIQFDKTTVRHVFRTKEPGSAVIVRDDSAYVPDQFKNITLEHDYESNMPSLRLGNMADLWNGLMDTNHRMIRIINDGTVRIKAKDFDGRAMKEAAALETLIVKGGFDEDVAKTLLKEAAAAGKTGTEYIVKLAYGAPVGDMINSAPGAPGMPEPVSEWEATPQGGVPAIAGQTQLRPVTDLSAARTDRSIYDPRQPDTNAIQLAQQATQQGQKEVFDTAVFGNMLNMVRNDNMVDRYLGDLMKGVDRLGRVIFLYYWHGDKFAERYGKSDMIDMEDALLNAFETTGEILLKLKLKSLHPSMEAGIDVDLSDVAAN